MSYLPLPSPDRAATFAPPNSPCTSSERIGQFRADTPASERANNGSFEEEDPLHPTEQQLSRMRNPDTISQEYLGSTRDTIPRDPGRIDQQRQIPVLSFLSTEPVNQDSIYVTFPRSASQAHDCPFRLLDCAQFFHAGRIALWDFGGVADSLQAKVAIPRLEEIETWMHSNRIYWVAVSYDASDCPPLVHSEAQDVHIRSDVLRELCNVAIKRFNVAFLWLDKLCVSQNSTTEVSRWRMPGNMKWAFGLAKGILFLPNGLNRTLPVLHGGELPVPARTSDLAVSFRTFLELAFNGASLKDVVVPVVYQASSHPEQGHPFESTNQAAEEDQGIPDLPVVTISLRDMLKESISEGVSEVGSDPQAIINPTDPHVLVTQMQQNYNPNVLVSDIYDTRSRHRLRVKALLTVLTCRDYLKSYYSGAINEGPTGTDFHARNPILPMTDWEEAIWRTVLFYRSADSPAQLVFGLAWLLQDLYDVQNPVQKSTVDLIAPVMAGVIEAEGLNLVTGETEPHFPIMPLGLSIVVTHLNEISAPGSTLVAKLLAGGPWKVPFSPGWIPHATQRYSNSASPSSASLRPKNRDLQLELGVVFNYSQRPILALRLTHLTLANAVPTPRKETLRNARTGKIETVNIYLIPIDIRAVEDRDARHTGAFDGTFLQLQRHTRATDCQHWQVVPKYASQNVEWSSECPAPEQCIRVSYQITPRSAVAQRTTYHSESPRLVVS